MSADERQTSNVLVDVSGICKLADFGCSKRLSDVASRTSSFKGTLRFMAPEVIKGISGEGYGR